MTMMVGEAALVPNLEPIMNLMGSVCLSTLGILIPAVIHSLLVCTDGLNWKSFLILSKDAFLILFALFVLVSGSSSSIKTLLRT